MKNLDTDGYMISLFDASPVVPKGSVTNGIAIINEALSEGHAYSGADSSGYAEDLHFMKLEKLFAGFLENCKAINLKDGTIAQHRGRIKTFLGPLIGDLDVDKILPLHRDMLLQFGSQVSEETGRRCIITLRRVLKYAKRRGVRLGVDLEDIEVPPYKRTKDVQALNEQDIEKVRSYLNSPKIISRHDSVRSTHMYSQSILRTRALFELLLHTGFRISEALSVDRKNVDFDRHEIRFKSLKTNRWETVYLFGAEAELKEYMASRKDNNPALFISCSGKRLCIDTAQSYLKKLKKRVKLKKNLTHHIFRSTFVTTFLRKKVDPRKTQLLARHTSLQTTLLYYYEVEKEELKPIHKEIMSLI